MSSAAWPRDAASTLLPAGSWLAVLGGGQLGRYFCMAAQSLGYRVCVLDPASDSPAGALADQHMQADYSDLAALEEIARRCAAATTEFENVPAPSLRFLQERIRVAPGADAVAIAQDRIAEKSYLRSQGLPIGDYAEIRCEADLAAAPADLFPAILKAARLGYDGKGQVPVSERSQALAAFNEVLSGEACVLERRLDLLGEVSVMVARDFDGAISTWPIAQNVHRDGILLSSCVPAELDRVVGTQAQALAQRVAQGLSYVGVLGVECFVVAGGRLLINEIAPRPHNSGHWTIDAAVTSQFEQQARILAGLPMGSTAALAPAAMLNLLGDCWADGEPDWASVLADPRVKLHLYGKREPRRGRKMGHLTVLGNLGDDLPPALQAAAQRLGIVL